METQPLNPLDNYDQLKKLEEVKKLVEENNQSIKQLQKSVKKIRNFIFWSQLFSWAKAIIIILAIVGGYVFLSPAVSTFMKNYGQIIQTMTGAKIDYNSITNPELQQLENLLSGYKNKLKP